MGKRTLLGTGEFTTSTASRLGGHFLGRCLGCAIALASALDGLVNDLGGRLGCPVRVELWVVA